MTKLTTERLEKFVNDIKTDGMCDITDSQVESALIRLFAYEQAAKNPVAYRNKFTGQFFTLEQQPNAAADTAVYEPVFLAAPVLPKQPVKPVMFIDGDISSDDAEKLAAVIREFALDEVTEAQPVIPEQANILSYFSFDPEDGAEILKDRQTAIDNCNASIDLYRESMQEEYPDGWSDDVKRVCWGVILQEARGFDAQGIPENDPNHTYQTLDYRLVPDLTTAVTTQPVSEPYKSAANDIIAERQRQISEEGWTPEHDDRYSCGELAGAAACYARYTNARGWVFPTNPSDYQSAEEPSDWPWAAEWWKPTNPRRDLVKAGALILAEIERMDRTAPAQESE